MDIIEIIRALLRQIKLVIILSVLCLAIGGFAFTQIGSQYVATADVQILPNNGANTENPLDKLSKNQSTVAEMIAVRLSSNNIRDEIAKKGLLSQYVAGPSTDLGSDAIPSLSIKVTGPKSKIVDDTKNELVNQTSQELKDLQKEIGAPKESWFQTQVLTETKTPFLETGSRMKSLLVLLVLSGTFIVSTALVVDGVKKSKSNDEKDEPLTNRGQTISLTDSEDSSGTEESYKEKNDKPRRSRITK